MSEPTLSLKEIFSSAHSQESKLFTNPQDEINYLREQLAQKEALAQKMEVPVTREQVAEHVVENYASQSAEEVLHPSMQTSEEESESIALRLSPEEHDAQIEELYGIVMSKGIKNALAVVRRMNNQHIEDDFHRFLVQYLQSSHSIPGLVTKSELYKSLDMRLFEVTLPAPDEGNNGTSISQLTALMEQFLAGMQSISSNPKNNEKLFYSLEVALSAGSDEIVFFVSVPSRKVDLFEKQILGLYDTAKIEEVFNDYNIFFENGASAGSYAVPQYKDLFEIKTYDKLENDPLKVLLNVFSKLDKETEGAAIQILVRPVGDRYIKSYGSTLDQLKKGAKLEDVLIDSVISETAGFGKIAWRETRDFLLPGLFGSSNDQDKADEDEKKVDENAVASVTEKLNSSIVETNIRIIASAKEKNRAQDIVNDLESAFHQFSNTKGNGIAWKRPSSLKQQAFFHSYAFRSFSKKQIFRLNLKEIASLYHFPVSSDSSPQLKQAKAGTAPVPVDLPSQGQILLGVNAYRGKETRVFMQKEDRVRHMYVIGQTGTGKTSILKNMIVQDIRNGDGCCFIDPHGSDIKDILALVPPERADDVIYFDPAATARPMAFNMLEYDERYPEQKSFVIDEMLGIFNKLFDMKTAGGPMFEQYFRNATALVVEDPESGSTLLDVSRVLADEKFRALKLSRCKNPIVVQFWEEIAQKAQGEASLGNIVPYITSKFDVFLSNEIMRPIVAQQSSSFNFRKVMDEKKILLVNLSKGRLGEINANLLGLIMVGKILMAALSRVDAPKDQRPDFYLYIDEFQNVTTNSIAQILSEARKYRLSLNVAHQFIAQLQEDIKNAVFGNVGSMAVFRVSSDDAQYLETRFKPTFEAMDIMKLDNYNAYLSMLSNGQPTKPFNVKTLAPEEGDEEMAKKLMELSFLKYGRPREEVDAEIMARYKKQRTEVPDMERLGL